ncbi:metal-dependent transcriptional regulator, partial [Candidatus Calescamantes bacterium]|nr:metal-dependent transcriptional regulator [Candidatus Calescamantes bacterium]
MVKNVLTISPSLEDYLEGIFILKQKKKIVRVKDLARYLKVKAPSVIDALKKLKEKNLIVHEY